MAQSQNNNYVSDLPVTINVANLQTLLTNMPPVDPIPLSEPNPTTTTPKPQSKRTFSLYRNNTTSKPVESSSTWEGIL